MSSKISSSSEMLRSPVSIHKIGFTEAVMPGLRALHGRRGDKEPAPLKSENGRREVRMLDNGSALWNSKWPKQAADE
eukprot:6180475-Pleurochrysis_carterae.AAC.2